MRKKASQLSASLEDYLEAMLAIQENKQEIRAREIMGRLKVSGPSVTEACQQLRDRGLINYTPYGTISLTTAGEKVARDVQNRHQTLREFFIDILGVEAQLADQGACRIEHAIPKNIVERLVLYTRYMNQLFADQVIDRDALQAMIKARGKVL